MKTEQPQPTLIDTAFDRAVIAALENSPQPAIPADFAARVAAKAALLPARRAASSVRYGRLTALSAVVVLTVALFALAPHATPAMTNVSYMVEMLVLLQIAALSYWLVRTGRETL